MNGRLHYLNRLPAEALDGQGASTSRAPTDEEETSMPTDQVLDVRSEVPARRHELIFDTYAALGSGEAFVLVNDHDPKPLYYQLAAEHEGAFSWDYLEQGPETWKVRIGRTAPA